MCHRNDQQNIANLVTKFKKHLLIILQVNNKIQNTNCGTW